MSDINRVEIAVIGMSCRVPGANDYVRLWESLLGGEDNITRASSGVPESAWIEAQGVIENPDLFDAARFKISRTEAELMDPQHRLFLEIAADALADAGYEDGRALGTTGVVAGVGENSYLVDNILSRPDITSTQGALQVLLGNEKDHVATRTAYRLNLTGPALTLQTSCSTSLVAIHVGVRLLQSGDADAVVVGGASLGGFERVGYDYAPDGILSPDGYCRAFDATAAGTVPGAGAAALVLRRLEDATRDGDSIHAVVKGSAINNDGRAKVGYTAPSSVGQESVLRAALDDAEVPEDAVGYVVAHGTGTPMGDAIEIEALAHVYGDPDRQDRLFLGSLKPNIGHLDAAAGVVNAMAGVLAVSRQMVPPSIHCNEPNSAIPAGNLEVPRRPFRLAPTSPYVGVSSFGLGGTNVHVVLGPPPIPLEESPQPDDQVVIPVTGRTEESAKEHQQLLLEWIKNRRQPVPWGDISYTLREGRSHREWRSYATVVGEGGKNGLTFSPLRKSLPRLRTALLFPGHGSQVAGALESLSHYEPLFDAAFRQVIAEVPVDRRDAVFTFMRQAGTIGSFSTEQLALFATQYSLARALIQRLGKPPSHVVGHSIGEYAAATIAGAIDVADAIRLIIARSEVLAKVADGAMLSVNLSPDELSLFDMETLDIAAINGRRSVVLSGPATVIDSLAARLGASEIKHQRLDIRTAAHSRLLEPHLEGFRQAAESVKGRAPKIPWLSSCTGEFVAGVADAEYWVNQLRDPVQMLECIRRLDVRGAAHVEVGVGMTLTRAFNEVHSSELCVPLLPDRVQAHLGDQYVDSLAELWSLGGDSALLILKQGVPRNRLHLPAPPFAREHFWVKPGARPAGSVSGYKDDSGMSQPEPEAKANVSVDSVKTRGVMQRLWATLLGVGVVEDDDNFFALGGESVTLLRLSQLINETWVAEVRLRDLARHSTFGSMCELLSAADLRVAHGDN